MSSFDLLVGAVLISPEQMQANAWVAVRRGRVASIRSALRWKRSGPYIDLRPWVAVPGLVNAHIHLELTGLSLPRPAPGKLEDWIAALLSKRAAWTHRHTSRAVDEGIRRCLASGTTTVGEIESFGQSRLRLSRAFLRARVFREFLGLDPKLAPSIWRQAQSSVRAKKNSRLRYGLSPHAPYSLSAQLLQLAGTWAQGRKMPLSIHCAESPAERELLERGQGRLLGTFKALGKWPRNSLTPGEGPIAFLDRFGLLGASTLLVHGNDLRSRELDTVRERGCTIAFCPGSHRFFRYEDYPLPAILRRNIPLALGTDSLASNEELSMLREMALLRQSFPRVSPQSVLTMATQSGARALGWEDRIGSLHPGKEADIAVLHVRGDLPRREILDRITGQEPGVEAVFVGGQRAFQA